MLPLTGLLAVALLLVVLASLAQAFSTRLLVAMKMMMMATVMAASSAMPELRAATTTLTLTLLLWMQAGQQLGAPGGLVQALQQVLPLEVHEGAEERQQEVLLGR